MSGLNPQNPHNRAGMDYPILHRSAWLVPITSAPVENGAVLVRNGVIQSAGPYGKIKAESPPFVKEVDHGSAALIPALVNAHTHLELTTLCGRILLPQESFASWLGQLMPLLLLLSNDERREGTTEGMRSLSAAGVILCGDIANSLCLKEEYEKSPLKRQIFLEVLGFNQDGLESALGTNVSSVNQGGAPLDSVLSLAAHSCYSVSEIVLLEAKEWCRSRGRIFSIHAAEHMYEIDFLQDGTGYCRELLEDLGRWVPHWTPPRTTPIDYMDLLGVLDNKTLLVHAVHMSRTDWEAVARNGCSVCFCPRSNANLNVGRPDMELAIKCGVPVALGTDSLASNSDFNLFAEAAFVARNYSDLSPESILSMITIGGARALQRHDQFGSIEGGKCSAMLVVRLPEYLPASELFESILHQGEKGAWRWAN